jgi:hypothetical protein
MCIDDGYTADNESGSLKTKVVGTANRKIVLHQYHQFVLEAFCEDIGAKLSDSRCIECFQSFMREVVSK